MKIELKNLKIYDGMSEETIAFTSDVYVNGKKLAYAKNDGRGGCTYYHPYDRELRGVLEQAEAYCKTLPSTFSTYGEKTIEIKSTLEKFIDDIVYKKYNDNVVAKNKKKLVKDMLKGICYGSENGYKILSWKGYTLEQLLNRNEGRVVIRKKIEELVNRGETILNTNLPKDNFGNYLF